jgi:hypothetical protein
MSKTESLHYQLCCLGAKFLKNRKNSEPWRVPHKYIAVELVTMGVEHPDIWATNGSITTIVEVKTSHADFLNDKKKWARSKEAEEQNYQMGNYRYYLCPDGIIKEDELPDKWGLLVYDGKKITKVKQAGYQKSSSDMELLFITSIMRRCGIKQQIFNFRDKNKKLLLDYQENVEYEENNYDGEIIS